jgi:hypothetical protein
MEDKEALFDWPPPDPRAMALQIAAGAAYLV